MRYSAFISYNFADRRWATWLHRALEAYRVPERVRGRIGPTGAIGDRLPPVFRDRDELGASADLGSAVREALAEAATLVVVCSPAAARSRWVNEEIRTFIGLGGGDRIRCLIVSGEPHAADPQAECLPPALLEGGRAEPLAADVRLGQDGKTAAKLKLVAGILGVPYDELRQREAARRQRRLALFAAAASIGFLAMAGLAVFALVSRQEAVQQRDIARQRTLTAERTVDFVKSLFEVSDPSEARGATITAREVLDRGVRQIEGGLADEPTVRVELGVTLGEVYGSLGLFRDGDRLIRRTFGVTHGQPRTRARQFLAFGTSQTRLGDYEGALRSFNAGLKALPAAGNDDADLVSRLLIGLSEAQSALALDAEADRSARQALSVDLARFGNSPRREIARDLEAIGLNHFYGGRMDKARPLFERALAIRLKTEGDLSPSVSNNLNALGSIAYMQGDAAAADRFFRSRLTVDERVLGPEHPDIAVTLNNIARVVLERRAFGEAMPLLERSLKISLKERDDTHDDLAFTFANLGIAQRGLGDVTRAEASLGRALKAAKAHNHRNLAPILAEIADIRCERGQVESGLRLLAEARPIMAQTYPDDPWRTAWVDNVQGGCLARAGRRDEARPLLTRSGAVILAKWPVGSLYAHAVEERRRT